MENSFYKINGTIENTVIIEKSKFICYVKGIENEEDAKNFISEIKKKNSLATHNCYAYIADEKGLIQKFSDDGEPQGTAGLPMLEALKNRNLKKTVAVCTRYFGGIKLGTGGLSRAYGGSVSEAVKKAEISEYNYSKILNIEFKYENLSLIQNILKNDKTEVIDTNFGDFISIKFAVKKEFYNIFINEFNEKTSGAVKINELYEDYFPYRFICQQ